jgi:hypothetical protein
MDLSRLNVRLDDLIRSGSRRARDRAASAADAIAAALPPGITATVARTDDGAAATIEAPGLAAREFGTATASARPVIGPVLDRLRASPPDDLES